MTISEGKILIVDDNASVLSSLELFLKNKFKTVSILRTPNQIQSFMEQQDYDIILLDMNFTAGVNNGNEGLFWLRKILKTDPTIVIILITAYSDIELAVTAMKEGAIDFILKPWDNKKLLATLQSGMKLRETQKQVKTLKAKQELIREDTDKHFKMFRGTSKKMKDIYSTMVKVAKTDASILITGENGTGKEVIAREIHNLSKRKEEVFISVDLGSLSESLFESEMFGHARGAFTDAKENRVGRFENASGGTLFLDEIGNLPLSLQTKLLNALESRKITPVGSNKSVLVDIRLISASNKDLNILVKTDLFREDLFYRLNTVQIELPPLRERDEDIILLANYFLKEYTCKYEKFGIKFSATTIDSLMSYNWPGNIRELKHTIEKAVILSEGDIIKPDILALNRKKITSQDIDASLGFEDAEKKIIIVALTRNKWNISEAARELKIGRQTLYRKIQKYDLQ